MENKKCSKPPTKCSFSLVKPAFLSVNCLSPPCLLVKRHLFKLLPYPRLPSLYPFAASLSFFGKNIFPGYSIYHIYLQASNVPSISTISIYIQKIYYKYIYIYIYNQPQNRYGFHPPLFRSFQPKKRPKKKGRSSLALISELSAKSSCRSSWNSSVATRHGRVMAGKCHDLWSFTLW